MESNTSISIVTKHSNSRFTKAYQKGRESKSLHLLLQLITLICGYIMALVLRAHIG